MKEIDCRSCTAACCGPNVFLPLTAEERSFLESSGTIIEEIRRPLPVRALAFFRNSADDVCLNDMECIETEAEYGAYILRSKCGWVGAHDGFEFSCRAYENPRRPKRCNDFSAGSEKCIYIRKIRGVDR